MRVNLCDSDYYHSRISKNMKDCAEPVSQLLSLYITTAPITLGIPRQCHQAISAIQLKIIAL